MSEHGLSGPHDPTEEAFRFLALGEPAQAESILRDILAATPGQPDALHGLACVARSRGQSALAVALVGRALQATGVSPVRRARMHITLGLALLAEGHAEPSRAALNVAILLGPNDPRAHAGVAEALRAQNRRLEARHALERAASLAADDAGFRTQLGAWLLEDGESDAAVTQFRKVTATRPDDGGAWANLGAALFEAMAFEEAKNTLERACVLGARTPETLNTLGLVAMATGDLCDARAALDLAVTLSPDDIRIANNFGTLLVEMGEEELALDIFDRIVANATVSTNHRAEAADIARAQFNRSTVLLGDGRFAEGWQAYESRRELLLLPQSAPQWNGTAGEVPVAITGEQGLGDEVQFLRFLVEASKRRPLRLRFATAGLANWLSGLDPERILQADGPVAAEASLLSLPFLLGERASPHTAPYLNIPKDLNVVPGRVGLCWSGRASYRFDRRRSISVTCLEELERVSGVRFVALQRGAVPVWMERVPLESLEDLARAVACCDLVISVDTLVAHLSGALGRPLWLLNRQGGDWRWKEIPWYSGVRQFRPRRGAGLEAGWSEVAGQVADALRTWRLSRA